MQYMEVIAPSDTFQENLDCRCMRWSNTYEMGLIVCGKDLEGGEDAGNWYVI